MSMDDYEARRAEERKREAEARARRLVLYCAVAAALHKLDPAWAKAPIARPADTERDEIVHTSGAILHLGVKDGTRLAIGGSFHSLDDGSLYDHRPYRAGRMSHDITVSMDRPPSVIAKEIVRRLVPDYLVEFAEALAQKRRADDNYAKAEGVARQLAALVGDEHLARRLKERNSRSGELQFGSYSDIQVKLSTYGESSTIEVRSESHAELRAVVLAVKAITDKRPKSE